MQASLRWRGGLTYLLVLSPFFGLPLVCCSSMGTLAVVEATRDAGHVTPSELTEVPEASRVEANLTLREVQYSVPDRYDPGMPAFERVYVVDEAPSVLAFGSFSWESQPSWWGEGGAVRGRVCDAGTSLSLACHLEPEVSVAIDGYAASQGRDRSDYRVLLVGEGTTTDWLGASCSFGAVALLLLLVGAGFVVVIRDGRVGPARRARERTWQLPLGADEILSLFRNIAVARAMEESPSHLVLALGRTEAQARLWGVRRPEQVPLKATLRVKTDGPYQGTRVELRVEEDWVWHRKLADPLVKLVDQALDRALETLGARLGPRDGER